MKKSREEKMIASLIRTIIAIIIIAIGVALGDITIHWYTWLPKIGLGFETFLIIMLYIIAALLIGYGVYLISPIYIGGGIYKMLEKGCDYVSIHEYETDSDEEEDDDDYGYQRMTFPEKVIKMKEKYLW